MSANALEFCPLCGEKVEQNMFAPEGHTVCPNGHTQQYSETDIEVALPARAIRPPSELDTFKAMLARANVRMMSVGDMTDPSQTIVSVENLDVQGGNVRADVEFVFEHGRLMVVRARKG